MQAVGDFNIKQQKRKKIATIVIFLIIFGIFAFWGGLQLNKWWQARKEYVRMGFAESKFPYRMFTERELVEKGLWSGESPALNAVPTRTTPEETYAKFRQALTDGDLDKAIECFLKDEREKIKDGLIEVLNNAELKSQMLNDLPKQIESIETFNKSTTYYDYSIMREGVKWAETMSFIKNWDGDWLIEDL